MCLRFSAGIKVVISKMVPWVIYLKTRAMKWNINHPSNTHHIRCKKAFAVFFPPIHLHPTHNVWCKYFQTRLRVSHVLIDWTTLPVHKGIPIIPRFIYHDTQSQTGECINAIHVFSTKLLEKLAIESPVHSCIYWIYKNIDESDCEFIVN